MIEHIHTAHSHSYVSPNATVHKATKEKPKLNAAYLSEKSGRNRSRTAFNSDSLDAGILVQISPISEGLDSQEFQWTGV